MRGRRKEGGKEKGRREGGSERYNALRHFDINAGVFDIRIRVRYAPEGAWELGSLTVAKGNFDHPVNGQKVNERAARSAPLPIDCPLIRHFSRWSKCHLPPGEG